MPKISKTSKVKKVAPKVKAVPVKAKAAPQKKKILKKVVKKIVPKKSNRITVDVISDEEPFLDNSFPKETTPVFSSWPDFGKKNNLENKTEAEDIYKEEKNEEVEDEVVARDDENLDKQKKFFSDWATQNQPKEGEEKPTLAPKKSVGLYRRQVVFYLGATIILLFAVFYLFFSKLTVTILPQGETVNDSLTFNIIAASSTASSTAINSDLQSNKTIDGEVSYVEVSTEKIYETSGEEVLGGAEVTGVVTLTNKSAKAQPLVVKTRLLSPDGKLFRLKEGVNIPAGGTITANIYADKPSAEMAVTANTRFTIPGLWAGLQDQIYAENSSDFTYQTQIKKSVTQNDIDRAKKDISEVLNLKVKNDLKSSEVDKIVVYDNNNEDISTEFNVKVGDEKSEFIVKAKKNVAVVKFSKEKAAALAEARLSLLVPDDKQLANFNQSQITYSLENFDVSTKVATVKSYFGGSIFLKSNSSLIDNKKLVGLNTKQISEYLNSFPEIKSYELKFSPSIIKTAPILPDLIQIKIQDAN